MRARRSRGWRTARSSAAAFPGSCPSRARGHGVGVGAAGASRVAASYSDSHIAVFDLARPRAPPVCHLRGHSAPSFYVKTAFSPGRDARRERVVRSARCTCGAWTGRGAADGSARTRGGGHRRGLVPDGLFDHRELRRRRHGEGVDDRGGGRGGGVFPASVEVGEGEGRAGGGGTGGAAGRRGRGRGRGRGMEAGEEEDAGRERRRGGGARTRAGDGVRPSSLVVERPAVSDARGGPRARRGRRPREFDTPSPGRVAPRSRRGRRRGRRRRGDENARRTNGRGGRRANGSDVAETVVPRPRADARDPSRRAAARRRAATRGARDAQNNSILTYFTPRRGDA